MECLTHSVLTYVTFQEFFRALKIGFVIEIITDKQIKNRNTAANKPNLFLHVIFIRRRKSDVLL